MWILRGNTSSNAPATAKHTCIMPTARALSVKLAGSSQQSTQLTHKSFCLLARSSHLLNRRSRWPHVRVPSPRTCTCSQYPKNFIFYVEQLGAHCPLPGASSPCFRDTCEAYLGGSHVSGHVTGWAGHHVTNPKTALRESLRWLVFQLIDANLRLACTCGRTVRYGINFIFPNMP